MLRPLTSGEQVEELFEGGLELGLIRDPEPAPGLTLEPLLTEALVAVVPERHPLASHHEVVPDDLAQEGMILFPYRLMPGFVAQVLRIFTPGRIPHVVQQAIHQETVVGLVAAGLGISILPESISRFQTTGVVIRPITTSPKTSLLIAQAGRPAPAAAEFVACLHDAVVAAATRTGGTCGAQLPSSFRTGFRESPMRSQMTKYGKTGPPTEPAEPARGVLGRQGDLSVALPSSACGPAPRARPSGYLLRWSAGIGTDACREWARRSTVSGWLPAMFRACPPGRRARGR